MIEAFRKVNFRAESLARIGQMREIIEEYSEQDLRLTARQLYYQFVARDLIPNTPKEYKKLTALLTDARYAGLVDWEAIEDRGRVPWSPSQWRSPKALVESALHAYRLPRWADQDTYVELWVEKQALAGVLEPLAREFHVTLSVNKGYSSASAMYEAVDRIKGATGWDGNAYQELQDAYAQLPGDKAAKQAPSVALIRAFLARVKPATIFYLGDHDPSGEDMVRDIRDRLKEFHRSVDKIEVRKIALTMDQIEQYNPPPNPAKVTDPRAAAYIRKYGDQSWEVDALPPNVLAQLIRDAFEEIIDQERMDAVIAQEETDRTALRKAVSKME